MADLVYRMTGRGVIVAVDSEIVQNVDDSFLADRDSTGSGASAWAELLKIGCSSRLSDWRIPVSEGSLGIRGDTLHCGG